MTEVRTLRETHRKKKKVVTKQRIIKRKDE